MTDPNPDLAAVAAALADNAFGPPPGDPAARYHVPVDQRLAHDVHDPAVDVAGEVDLSTVDPEAGSVDFLA